MKNVPVQVIDVKQEREMEYERDETGRILVMHPKVSSLRSTLTLLLPSGETMDLPISNEAAEQLLNVCAPS